MIKQLLLSTVFAVLMLGAASAQTTTPEQRSYPVHFAWNKWQITSDAQRAELAKALEELSGQPDAKVAIVGWTDRTGTERANRSMSLRRAESVRDYLIGNGISAERITVSGEGVDTRAANNSKARRADVTLTFYVQEAPAEQPKQPEQKKEEVEVEDEQPFVIVEPQPAVVEQAPAPRNKFSLRTNLLYWVGGLMNIGAEWKPSASVGILVNGGYAPWSSNSWKHNWAGWFVSPEVRLYLGEQKRWFAGAQFLAGDYNIKTGDIGRQGSVIAGGITGGYKLPLTKCLDMDFSLGLGYGQLKYDAYRRSDNGVNVFTGKGITKTGVMPIQAGVSLIWKIK